MIDGSDNNDISVTIATSQVVPEAVAEFQVMQNPYSVEFGRNSGGQINVITKSGLQPVRRRLLRLLPASGMNSRSNIDKSNSLTDAAQADPSSARRRHRRPDHASDKLFFFGLFQRDTQSPAEPSEPDGGHASRPRTASPRWRACRSATVSRGEPSGGAAAISFSATSTGRTRSSANPCNDAGQRRAAFRRPDEHPIFDPSKYHTYMGRRRFPSGARATTSPCATRCNDRVGRQRDQQLSFGACSAGWQDLLDTNFAASNAHIFSASMLNEVALLARPPRPGFPGERSGQPDASR